MSGCCGAGDVLYIIKDVERVAACPLQPEPCELCHQLVKQVQAGCTLPMHHLMLPLCQACTGRCCFLLRQAAELGALRYSCSTFYVLSSGLLGSHLLSVT